MFPGGWPGAGLLILRLAAADRLVVGMSSLGGVLHSWHPVLPCAVLAVGVLLLAGLWARIAGALQAIGQVVVVFARGYVVIHVLPAAMGVGMVMVGAGGW